MLVNQKVDTAIPADLLVSSERRSNFSPEPDPGLNHRLHRKYLAGTRSLHVCRPSTIDLPTLHHRVERIIRPARRVRRNDVDVTIHQNPGSLLFTLKSGIGVRPRTFQTYLRAYSPADGLFRDETNGRL